mmetsp:Transcript_4061/g.6075  ORF Transcript_4061/g.6075 Transcript_4061/m.6075 type:complete len:113 (-) Transcript_4061:249-587(-)
MLKSLMISIFHLSQAYIETDSDGKQRLYFWEPPADFNGRNEAKQNRILEWLYHEFNQQIFGPRQELSCIQFIDRISCKFNKSQNPNKQSDEEEAILSNPLLLKKKNKHVLYP